jgi:hypothetical protein
MSAKSVTISKKELLNISNILTLSKFKDVENITIEDSGSIGGLGSILTLSFDHTIGGIKGTFSTEISGVETW